MGDKFIISDADLAETSAHGPWKCLVTGRPVDDVTAWEGGANGCGLYYDGADYSDSTTFDGTLNGRQMVCADSSNKKAAKVTSNAYFTNAPAIGTKYSSITLYLEDSNDDGECQQESGGVSFYKYDATAV